MIETSPIKVIHWDYNKPDRTSSEIPSQQLFVIPIKTLTKDEDDKKSIGFRFTYRIKTKETCILSYIAECYFIMDKTEATRRAEIIKMISDFYTLYEIEFDERKKGIPANYHTLLKWEEATFDHTPSLRLLME